MVNEIPYSTNSILFLFLLSPEDDDEDKEEFTEEDEAFLQELTLEKAACMAAGVPMDDSDGNSNLVVLPHQLPRSAYVPPVAPDAIEPLFETVDGKIPGIHIMFA